MPSKSPKQARFMRAIAHGWRPTRMVKPPPMTVAKDFVAADQSVGKFAEGGMAGFRVTGHDAKSFHVEGRKGPFKIAKAGLSPQRHDALLKMCGGGKVKKMAGGGAVTGVKQLAKEVVDNLKKYNRLGIRGVYETTETIPGRATGHMPGLVDQSRATRNVFARHPATQWTDDEGYDLFYNASGHEQFPARRGFGEFQEGKKVDRNPNTVFRPTVAQNPATGTLDARELNVVDQVNQWRSILDAQTARAYNMPDAGAASANALEVKFPRQLGDSETAKLFNYVRKRGLNIIDNGGGRFVITGEYGGIAPEQFMPKIPGTIDKVEGMVPRQERPRTNTAQYQGNYQEIPWGPEGSGQVTKWALESTDPMLTAQWDASPELRKRIAGRNAVENDFAATFSGVGKPRPDIQRLRSILGDSGWAGLRAHVAKYGYAGLPAALAIPEVKEALAAEEPQGFAGGGKVTSAIKRAAERYKKWIEQINAEKGPKGDLQYVEKPPRMLHGREVETLPSSSSGMTTEKYTRPRPVIPGHTMSAPDVTFEEQVPRMTPVPKEQLPFWMKPRDQWPDVYDKSGNYIGEQGKLFRRSEEVPNARPPIHRDENGFRVQFQKESVEPPRIVKRRRLNPNDPNDVVIIRGEEPPLPPSDSRQPSMFMRPRDQFDRILDSDYSTIGQQARVFRKSEEPSNMERPARIHDHEYVYWEDWPKDPTHRSVETQRTGPDGNYVLVRQQVPIDGHASGPRQPRLIRKPVTPDLAPQYGTNEGQLPIERPSQMPPDLDLKEHNLAIEEGNGPGFDAYRRLYRNNADADAQKLARVNRQRAEAGQRPFRTFEEWRLARREGRIDYLGLDQREEPYQRDLAERPGAPKGFSGMEKPPEPSGSHPFITIGDMQHQEALAQNQHFDDVRKLQNPEFQDAESYFRARRRQDEILLQKRAEEQLAEHLRMAEKERVSNGLWPAFRNQTDGRIVLSETGTHGGAPAEVQGSQGRVDDSNGIRAYEGWDAGFVDINGDFLSRYGEAAEVQPNAVGNQAAKAVYAEYIDHLANNKAGVEAAIEQNKQAREAAARAKAQEEMRKRLAAEVAEKMAKAKRGRDWGPLEPVPQPTPEDLAKYQEWLKTQEQLASPEAVEQRIIQNAEKQERTLPRMSDAILPPGTYYAKGGQIGGVDMERVQRAIEMERQRRAAEEYRDQMARAATADIPNPVDRWAAMPTHDTEALGPEAAAQRRVAQAKAMMRMLSRGVDLHEQFFGGPMGPGMVAPGAAQAGRTAMQTIYRGKPWLKDVNLPANGSPAQAAGRAFALDMVGQSQQPKNYAFGDQVAEPLQEMTLGASPKITPEMQALARKVRSRLSKPMGPELPPGMPRFQPVGAPPEIPVKPWDADWRRVLDTDLIGPGEPPPRSLFGILEIPQSREEFAQGAKTLYESVEPWTPDNRLTHFPVNQTKGLGPMRVPPPTVAETARYLWRHPHAQTKEALDFLGNTAVRDEATNEPVLGFHASHADNLVNLRTDVGSGDDAWGMWFAENPRLANAVYTWKDKVLAERVKPGGEAGALEKKLAREGHFDRPNVTPFVLSIQKPLIATNRLAMEDEIAQTLTDQGADIPPMPDRHNRHAMKKWVNLLRNEAMRLGYDGIRLDSDLGFGRAWVIFKGNQAKNAISNSGRYGKSSNSLRALAPVTVGTGAAAAAGGDQ